MNRIYKLSELLGLKIKFKNESFLMKIISLILFFNKDFSNLYITTIGNTCYFPNREFLEKHIKASLITICHEYVHANDNEKNKLFPFLYLFPQILAPFMLMFGFYSWILALILFTIFLLPIPSYFRKIYELRGYKMSLFAYNELNKEEGILDEKSGYFLANAAIDFNKCFINNSYYFMWPFGVLKELAESIKNIQNGDILSEDEVYLKVKAALVLSKNS